MLKMKKFINNIDDVLVESLSGFATAHADLVTLHLDPHFLPVKIRRLIKSPSSLAAALDMSHYTAATLALACWMQPAQAMYLHRPHQTKCSWRPSPYMQIKAYCLSLKITPAM